MNTPQDRLDPAQEREWQAQELARQEERRCADPAGSDPRIAQYRLLARALRHPPLDPVPADFAAGVVARATATGVVIDDRLEAWLLRGSLIVLALAAAVVVALYGGAWLRATLTLLPGSDGFAMNWMLVLLVCITASSIFEQWRRERGRD